MKLNFCKRKTFYLSENYNKSISFEIAGFDSTPAIEFRMDGDDQSYQLHLAFGIGLWITLTRLFPESWFPNKDHHFGRRRKREIGLAFHHWSLWINLWHDPMCWSNTDPKWWAFHIDFKDLIIGKHTCKWNDLGKEQHIISMAEGNYAIQVKKQERIDSWQRWFTRKSISWDVEAGYYEGEEFIKCPIPKEGKGENSWDCDEDATYSMSFSAKYWGTLNEIKYHYQAALHFENDMKKSRIRRGGTDWLPERFKDQKFSHIKIATA